MSYIFDRSLIINKELNVKYFKELDKFIGSNNMTNYNNWDWLANILKEALEYLEMGYSKPMEINNQLAKLNKYFSWTGDIYRGYIFREEDINNIPNLKSNEYCSWSSQYDVASRFAESSDYPSCIIKTYAVNALDFASMLSELLENCPNNEIYNYFENFFGEDEVLYPVLDFKIIESSVFIK